MIIEKLTSNSALAQIVKEYYFIDIKADEINSQIPIIDDRSHDFIVFKQADAVFTYGLKETKQPISSKIFTILDVEPPYKIEFKKDLSFFTMKLQPWMNNNFFSSMNKSGIINLENYDASLMQLHQLLLDNAPVKKLVEQADEFFLAQQIKLSGNVDFVQQVCEFIVAKKGMVQVNEISEVFDKSRQYINRVFKKEVMCSLKDYIIAIKIVDLIKHYKKNSVKSLTVLSYEYGYFDQAHFINDFKKVSGLTPKQFFDDYPPFLKRHL